MWVTFSYSNFNDISNSITEYPEVGVLLPEWRVTLHLSVRRFLKRANGRTRYLLIQHRNANKLTKATTKLSKFQGLQLIYRDFLIFFKEALKTLRTRGGKTTCLYNKNTSPLPSLTGDEPSDKQLFVFVSVFPFFRFLTLK